MWEYIFRCQNGKAKSHLLFKMLMRPKFSLPLFFMAYPSSIEIKNCQFYFHGFQLSKVMIVKDRV